MAARERILRDSHFSAPLLAKLPGVEALYCRICSHVICFLLHRKKGRIESCRSRNRASPHQSSIPPPSPSPKTFLWFLRAIQNPERKERHLPVHLKALRSLKERKRNAVSLRKSDQGGLLGLCQRSTTSNSRRTLISIILSRNGPDK